MKHAADLGPMTLEQDWRITETVERVQSRLSNFIRRRVPDPCDVNTPLSRKRYAVRHLRARLEGAYDESTNA